MLFKVITCFFFGCNDRELNMAAIYKSFRSKAINKSCFGSSCSSWRMGNRLHCFSSCSIIVSVMNCLQSSCIASYSYTDTSASFLLSAYTDSYLNVCFSYLTSIFNSSLVFLNNYLMKMRKSFQEMDQLSLFSLTVEENGGCVSRYS